MGMRTIITDVLNIFTMTYDHGILLVEQGFAEGKGAEQGGSEVTWRRVGTNIRGEYSSILLLNHPILSP